VLFNQLQLFLDYLLVFPLIPFQVILVALPPQFAVLLDGRGLGVERVLFAGSYLRGLFFVWLAFVDAPHDHARGHTLLRVDQLRRGHLHRLGMLAVLQPMRSIDGILVSPDLRLFNRLLLLIEITLRRLFLLDKLLIFLLQLQLYYLRLCQLFVLEPVLFLRRTRMLQHLVT